MLGQILGMSSPHQIKEKKKKGHPHKRPERVFKIEAPCVHPTSVF